MNSLQKQSLAFIGGVSMMLNAGAALSSTTHASALIDWSTFSITGYALGTNQAPSFTLTGQSSITSSSVSDWLSWNSEVTNTAGSVGVNIAGTAPGVGSGSAQRNGSLAVSGSGFLVISANYALSAGISSVSCAEYFCYEQNAANASASFDLVNTSGNGNHQSRVLPTINLGNSSVSKDQKQGTLSVGVLVNDGDILNFSSSVSAFAREIIGSSVTGNAGDFGSTLVNAPVSAGIAAVPLPGTAWLFGSTLLGLLGWRRKAG